MHAPPKKATQFARLTGKDTEMPARMLSVAGFVLIALGSATQVSADWCFGIFNSLATDVKRRQCWPDPFEGPDRATVRAPCATMVANGWRRQNMLGEYHFEPGTGQLTEAGRLKVRWILTSGPQQHRLIYVHVAEGNEETSARIAAVQQCAAQIAPHDLPPVLPTSISDEGWPADRVDLIGRKFQAATPPPRLPPSSGTSGSGNGSGGN
jgi:hypothetical protein